MNYSILFTIYICCFFKYIILFFIWFTCILSICPNFFCDTFNGNFLSNQSSRSFNIKCQINKITFSDFFIIYCCFNSPRLIILGMLTNTVNYQICSSVCIIGNLNVCSLRDLVLNNCLTYSKVPRTIYSGIIP